MTMTGFSKKELSSSGFAANPSESLCHCVTSPLWKRGTNHQPAAHPTANLRRLRRHRRALKGRRLSVQYRRQLGPSPSRGRRLTTSGFTALSDTSPISSSRAVEACQSMLSIRIATATTSREIFLVNDYDGIFKDGVEKRELKAPFQRLRRKCTPLARFAGLPTQGSISLISRSPAAPYEISSFATPKGEASPKPAAHPSANLRQMRLRSRPRSRAPAAKPQ